MASQTEITNMAVFCDFENVALGVRDANYAKFDIDKVLERLLLKGNIVVRKAYCDWDRYKQFKRAMHEASFELIEIPHVRQSGKNSADIRMVVDALDLCYTKAHLDTFVLLTGDSDFSPLVAKLRENAKTVIGVGVKQSTSDLLINICDEFIYYDDLVREQPPGRGGVPRGRSGSSRRPGSARPDGNGHAVPPMVGPPLPLHESLRDPARAAPRGRNGDGAGRDASVDAGIESGIEAGIDVGVEAGIEALARAVLPRVPPTAEPVVVTAEGGDAAVGSADAEPAGVPAPRGRARAKSTRARAGSRRGAAAAAPDTDAGAADGDASATLADAAAAATVSEPAAAPADDATGVDTPAPAAKGRARRPRAGSKAALAAAAKLAEEEAEAAAEPAVQPMAVKIVQITQAGTNPAAIHPADPVSDGSDKAQQAIDLVLATVEALVAERGEEERIWGSMVKQTLKRRNPGFNESYYGFRTFSELLEEAQARRLLELTRDEKSGGFILRLTHNDD